MDSYEEKYSDTHLMYGMTEYATREQINKCIYSLLTSLGWSETGLITEINVVTAANDEITKYSYVWVSSSKVFQLLTKTGDVTHEKSYQYVIKYGCDVKDTDDKIKEIIETGINDGKEYLYEEYEYEEECQYSIHRNTDDTLYVTLESEAIYNMLLGNNPDGTLRETTVLEECDDDDTTDWAAGEMVTKKLKPLIELQPIDDVDLKVEEYGCQVPKRCLEKRHGLKFDQSIVIPSIYYERSQIDSIKVLEPDRTEFFYSPKFSPAMIAYPDETQYNKNELIAYNVSDWITVRIIKEKFRNYVTDKDAIYDDGRNRCTYPFIRIKFTKKDTKLVIVKFNKDSNDGLIANKMTRKMKVFSEDGKRSETLRFDYSKVFN